MKSLARMVVGVALASALSSAALHAEDGQKSLPTLLIKGEVISLNTTDPSAALLTVKDRYGFETPIYLTPETKVNQGDAAFDLANLMTGTGVEVEYNFDVNTAKRHAVSVKVAQPAATAAPAPAPTPVAPTEAVPVAPAPETSATPAPEAAPAAPEGEAAPAPSETETTAPQESTESAPVTP